MEEHEDRGKKLVKEGKAGNEVVVTVETRLSKVLTVVTDKLKEGKHSKTSVLKLGSLTLGQNVIRKVKNSGGGCEPSISLNGSNESNHLGPSSEGDGIKSSNTVGNIIGAKLSGDQIVTKSVSLGGNISKNGKHGSTSVLELSKTVEIELLLRDTIGELGGVEKSSWGEGANLVLERGDGCGGASSLGGSESSSSGNKRGDDGGLHGSVGVGLGVFGDDLWLTVCAAAWSLLVLFVVGEEDAGS